MYFNEDYPKILISGNYNIFDTGWDGCGVYMASGLYSSATFKYPMYIGSSIRLQCRIEYQHITFLNKNKHPTNTFQNAWNQHATKEGFVWFLLEACPSEGILLKEQKYLDYYRPFADEFGGFNISKLASGGGFPCSEETKEKLRIANLGKIISEEQRRIVSEKQKGIKNHRYGKKHSEEFKKYLSEINSGENNGFYGKKHTEETKAIIKEKRKLQDMSYLSKPVKQSDLDTGEIINIWRNATEASRSIYKCDTTISSVCRGSGIKYGFKWEYVSKEEYLVFMENDGF